MTLTSAHKNLTMLGAAGEVAREWRKRGGKRACYMFSAATGEAWGPHTRQAPGGGRGAREKVLTYLSDTPEWFSLAEISGGSDAGTEAHTSRVVNELVAAGFVQKRRAPLPRKDVRWQYRSMGDDDVPDERPWYEDLDPEEYAELFPRGQADIDAWVKRQTWREQNQDFPRTCDDPGALMDLARIILGANAGTATTPTKG